MAPLQPIRTDHERRLLAAAKRLLAALDADDVSFLDCSNGSEKDIIKSAIDVLADAIRAAEGVTA
jgi:hypothetical protein